MEELELQETSARLLEALRNNPAVYWRVLLDCRLVGAWVERQGKHYRLGPGGHNRIFVTVPEEGKTEAVLQHLAVDGTMTTTNIPWDPETFRAAADAVLIEHGYTLKDE